MLAGAKNTPPRPPPEFAPTSPPRSPVVLLRLVNISIDNLLFTTSNKLSVLPRMAKFEVIPV